MKFAFGFGLGMAPLIKGVGGAPAEPAVLLETGDDLLLESGEPLLLEA